MAISKVVYKSSANATPEVWMDATTATAAAADITAPKTAMLADGVMTTGTGSGGGGGSSYTLLATQEFEINTTSTSTTTVGQIPIQGIGDIRDSGEKIIYIQIFDKAGKRNGYYYGGWFASVVVNTINGAVFYVKSTGEIANASSAYGVYPGVTSNGVIIYSRYISSFGVLNGTFTVQVYTLDWPNNDSPF